MQITINYNKENRKLTNVTEGTVPSDAITKHQLDTAMIDKHDNIKPAYWSQRYLQCHQQQTTDVQLNERK